MHGKQNLQFNDPVDHIYINNSEAMLLSIQVLFQKLY